MSTEGQQAKSELVLDLLLDLTYSLTLIEERNDLNSVIFQFNPFPLFHDM